VLPAEPTAVLEAAGFSRGEVEAAGMTRDSRWSGRVCFEWKDELGRLSSMWGRAVTGEEPKYLVLSGGSPALFGADVAVGAARRRRPAHGVVVVEGMFDVLSLRAVGIDEVAGVEERVDLVRLHVERVDVDLDAGKLELHLHDLAAPFPPLPPPPQEDDPDGDEAPEEAES